jgi:large-conductance mechanosensitive channel
MTTNDSGYIRKDLPVKIGNIGMILLASGIIFGIFGFITYPERAAFSYLPTFMFLLSISVGSLFWVALEYLAGAEWSVPFRRVAEFLSTIIPLLIILVIPLLMHMKDLFIWMNPVAVASSKVLQGKEPYLNYSFFLIRVIGFCIIWVIFYFIFIRNSRKQDITGEQGLTKNNVIFSGIFMPVFAYTITFSAVDWLMSLAPLWFSTIFGAYLFSGAVWSSLAAITFISIKLKENGYLHPKVNENHYYSLGTLLFAFTVFWAYIAFSQYMLIWYADLPEESFWFLHRWTGGWSLLSIIVIITHFIVPFGALLSFPSKTNTGRLKFISIWILAAHYIDLYWLIMPSLYVNGKVYTFSWLDIVFPIGAVGLIMAVFNWSAKRYNLIPIKDPKLQKAFNFRI